MIILSYVVLNASINPSPGSPKMTSTSQSSRASATISAMKDPNNIKVILLTYPKIDDRKSQPTNEGQRFPLTGTIDQVGNDIQRIKQMGIDHIIFAYNFIPIGRDLNKVMEITKQSF